MKSIKKLRILFMCCILCVMSFRTKTFAANQLNSYCKIEYGYTTSVTPGTIRYVGQNPNGAYFYTNYWTGLVDAATYQCQLAAASMALSYVNVNKLPKDLGKFAGPANNYGAAQYTLPSSVSSAVDNLINGNGKYSPVVIHVKPYPSSGGEHWLVVAGRVSGNTYQIVEPWNGSRYTFNTTIEGNTIVINGGTYPIDFRVQYYNPNASITKEFKSWIDGPANDSKYNGSIKIEGWAVYGEGISKVTCSVNGHTYTCSRRTRTDVAKAYPGYPTGTEGFYYTIPTSALKDGNNTITMTAYGGNKTFNIGSVRVKYVNNQLFRSYIDSPSANSSYTTGVKVEGWAVYNKSISKVKLTVNGYTFTCNRRSRSDISSVYPGYATSKAGFYYTIPTKYLKNGKNTISINAYIGTTKKSIGSASINYKNTFRSYIDTEIQGKTFKKSVTIQGWAVYGTGIDSVKYTLNGRTVKCSRKSRNDVAQVYPGYDTVKAGFYWTVPLSYMKKGTNKITFYAYKGSNRFTIGSRTFTCKK